MKKFLIVLAVLLILIGAGIYFGTSSFLTSYSANLLETLQTEAAQQGIAVRDASFDSIRQSAWNRITCYGFRAAIRYKQDGGVLSGRTFALKIQELSFELLDVKSGKIMVSMKTADFIFPKKETPKAPDQVRVDYVEFPFSVDLKNLSASAKRVNNVYKQITRLASEGRTELNLKFSGVSRFQVSGKPVQARLFLESFRRENFLRMNKEDLGKISQQLDEKFTDDEINLFSREPVRAPKLLQIRDQASTRAHEIAQARNPAGQRPVEVYRPTNAEWSKDQTQTDASIFPEDAYRIVYWSYLLTKQYGEEFAREVTDAHESSPDNPEREKQMDLNNAKLGRTYFLSGVQDQALLDRVLYDPKVIRSAESPEKVVVVTEDSIKSDERKRAEDEMLDNFLAEAEQEKNQATVEKKDLSRESKGKPETKNQTSEESVDSVSVKSISNDESELP